MVLSGSASQFIPSLGRIARWWRLPFWVLQLATGAKSFADNPILGSRTLNRLGLHASRLKAAHALAKRRRRRLAGRLPRRLREEFERNGFVVLRDFLPAEEFTTLRSAMLHTALSTRAHRQGDTVTRRVSIGLPILRRFPQLRAILEDPIWTGLMAYVASSRTKPLYYIQTILGAIADGPPDPQLQLHSDTFHPSLKAWLFLTDVPEDGRPLTYVAGSHRLSPARIAWEKRKSVEVLENGDPLSRRGSFRISPEELGELGLPPPTSFAVPANTLVVVDTCGFHARGDSDRPTTRVELWAYCRRTPFVPWTSGGILSWNPIAVRRADWLNVLLDWLDRKGLRKQQWAHDGLRRPIDPRIYCAEPGPSVPVRDHRTSNSRAA